MKQSLLSQNFQPIAPFLCCGGIFFSCYLINSEHTYQPKKWNLFSLLIWLFISITFFPLPVIATFKLSQKANFRIICFFHFISLRMNWLQMYPHLLLSHPIHYMTSEFYPFLSLFLPSPPLLSFPSFVFAMALTQSHRLWH